ncbi:MAG TPA: bifunctional nuclease family protein [Actinomycetales bacterium]|nr:bifunctional nuclease family protein [Actinomycetales bacterium]
MRDVEVIGVRIELPSTQPVVLLREKEGDRVLPIMVGAFEAMAIAAAQEGVVPPRPMTHDLFVNVLEALEHQISGVEVTGMSDGVFFSDLIMDGATRVSARPSDAIALALRTGSPIRCSEEILDEAAISAPHEEDAEIEEFRAFLDEVSPEDFGSG